MALEIEIQHFHEHEVPFIVQSKQLPLALFYMYLFCSECFIFTILTFVDIDGQQSFYVYIQGTPTPSP